MTTTGTATIGVLPAPLARPGSVDSDLCGGAVMAQDTCSVNGCEKPVRGRGWCASHYGRWYRHGDPLTQVRPGRGSGRALTTDGYVQLLGLVGHPLADARGRVLEHRKVVHDAGIVIPPGWHVHHLNGVRTDNRLENLEVVDPATHGRGHAAEGHAVRWGYEMAAS